MRHAALAFALLAATAVCLPARAQSTERGGLPCWGFCQLWMGQQDDAALPSRRPRLVDRERADRWRRSRTALRRAERREAVEESFAEPAWHPHRFGPAVHLREPVVAQAKPAIRVAARPVVVAPARMVPVSAPATAMPVAAPAAPAKAPAASGASSAIPAAPLE